MLLGTEGSREKNLAELKKILPNGSSFEALVVVDVASVCTHVNNYPRKSLGRKMPFSRVARLLFVVPFEEFRISKLKADEVIQKPSLLPNE